MFSDAYKKTKPSMFIIPLCLIVENLRQQKYPLVEEMNNFQIYVLGTGITPRH